MKKSQGFEIELQVGCPRERFLAINSGKLREVVCFFAGLFECLLHTKHQKTRFSRAQPDREIFTWLSIVEILKMTISKILDFSAGSKFAIQLPQDIRYDRESQNCD